MVFVWMLIRQVCKFLFYLWDNAIDASVGNPCFEWVFGFGWWFWLYIYSKKDGQ
jgi:hypothetical protein